MSFHRVVCVTTIPSIGATYNNAIHLANPDGALSPLEIGAELRDNFITKIRGWQSDFLGWQFLYISDINNPEAGSTVFPMDNVGGLAHTGYLYPTLCYKLKWQTTGTGRHKFGRFFISGGRNDWSTAGGITASAATNGGILLADILARYSSTGTGPLTLGIVQQDSGGPIFHSVETGSFWNYLGQQRRRNYGVGV